jgi:hypothetical protein
MAGERTQGMLDGGTVRTAIVPRVSHYPAWVRSLAASKQQRVSGAIRCFGVFAQDRKGPPDELATLVVLYLEFGYLGAVGLPLERGGLRVASSTGLPQSMSR